ncbi:hydroxymethylbilane synthase [bacterium]|nr:hydroxymethylbilane synthase [bacterium]
MADARLLRLGTRGSRLALAQGRAVASAIETANPGLSVEIVIIQTTGDKVLDSPLSRIGGKGVFTKEIEEALLDGRIDLAVHSLKDLPTLQPPGLALGAITQREDPRDVLIAAREVDWLAFGPESVVGTSSLRRRAQLRHGNPNLRIEELRGNVPTRIQRLMEGGYTAIVLAAAGIHRLGIELPWHHFFAPAHMLPAPGQGALGLQVRDGDAIALAALARLHHPETAAACTAERTLLQALGGGCQLPLGALGTVEGGRLHLMGRVNSLAGDRVAEASAVGDVAAPEALGRKLAELLIVRGAQEILAGLDLVPPNEGFDHAVAVAAAMDRGPLGGRTIVVTRDEDADGPLSLAIRRRGGQPLVLPLVRHLPPEDVEPLRQATEALVGGGFDWLVFTSSRAVEALAARLNAIGANAAGLAVRVACVGEATAASARETGFTVELIPADAQASALAGELAATGMAGARVLYPRADATAGTIREILSAAGAQVSDPVAYRTSGEADDADVRRLLGSRRVDAVLVCSPSAVESIGRLERSTQERLLGGAVIGSIGPRTSSALSSVGIAEAVEPAGDRSFESLVEAVTRAIGSLPLS